MIRKIALLVLLSVLFTAPAMADPWDKWALQFDLGTTIAASGSSSSIARIPQASQIDAIYLTSSTGAVASTADYLVVTFYLNGSAYGTFTSSATTLVANTPKILTPTGYNLAAGDYVQFKLTKVGLGTPTTDLGVTLSGFNTTSTR